MEIGILFAVLCALCWSGLDALRKALGQHMSAFAAAGALSTGGALLFLGPVALEPPTALPPLQFWLCVAGSAGLNLISNILFVRAIQLSPLALTIPYLSFSPVLILAAGAVFLQQHPSALSLLGVGLVVLGAVGLNPTTEGKRFSPIEALRRERGSVYMLWVAILWSLAPILDRWGLQYSSISFYSFGLNLLSGLPLLAFVALRQPSELVKIRRRWALLAATVAVLGLAMFTQYRSWDYLFVAYTDAIKRAGGMVFSTLLGYLVFGERQLKRRLPAVALMGLGVAIILVGSGS